MTGLFAFAVPYLKRLAIAAAVLIVLGGLGGFFVMLSGIVPIKASSGHWAITEAILDAAKRRSVATHTLGMKVPPLDRPGMVIVGAGQYGFACEPCHGSPAVKQPRVAARMTPRPPDLRDVSLSYAPDELFYIVKHGIKFTGMPAWPSRHRDDEVWSMVAFLRELPAMDAKTYEDLTGRAIARDDQLPMEDMLGPAADLRPAITQNCARCHGVDGRGRGPGALPRLAGQRWEYIAGSLEAYARGERHSGIMEPVAANLGADEMQAIARYYAALPPVDEAAGAVDAMLIQQGREIAERGAPERLVPACNECHGPGTERNPNYPRLAGQHADYIAQQLGLFKGDRRGGTAYRRIMLKFAGQLTAEQVEAVAAYYASLREP
jgi:cytochrome c553